MTMENLWSNFNSINQGKKHKPWIFIIETPQKLEQGLKIGNSVSLYPLDHIDWEIENKFHYYSHKFKLELQTDDISLRSVYNKLQLNGDNLAQSYYYLLEVSIVLLVQNPSKSGREKLDPDIGPFISSGDICLDLLHILSLYYKKWFRLLSILEPIDNQLELTLAKPEFSTVRNHQDSKNLSSHIYFSSHDMYFHSFSSCTIYSPRGVYHQF
ncbi:MAG: hypothetical protein ACFFC7_02550 [Candidatus Hermodarchaeota archaeon]